MFIIQLELDNPNETRGIFIIRTKSVITKCSVFPKLMLLSPVKVYKFALEVELKQEQETRCYPAPPLSLYTIHGNLTGN